ncbi:hypothetical protein ASPFODRAFT_307904 [Aspergillus luchuensis CBS 106.47]|uniref:Uncharacterized protein n=1 Tax=Aspergillus luchuensis (strain CBS 106.47) TaxID=1137211 RepID=A0A1M3T8R2_ASPLC|nr:hypothetical protein ASPFODRAFT_307904 [Aspergillus luchuensis CBS 106.47]
MPGLLFKDQDSQSSSTFIPTEALWKMFLPNSIQPIYTPPWILILDAPCLPFFSHPSESSRVADYVHHLFHLLGCLWVKQVLFADLLILARYQLIWKLPLCNVIAGFDIAFVTIAVSDTYRLMESATGWRGYSSAYDTLECHVGGLLMFVAKSYAGYLTSSSIIEGGSSNGGESGSSGGGRNKKQRRSERARRKLLA